MKQAVMYGGGNIGRGFIGATLSQSGYEVTFIDVAEPLVKALQEKHQYPVRYVSSEGYEDIMIEPSQPSTAMIRKRLPKRSQAVILWRQPLVRES